MTNRAYKAVRGGGGNWGKRKTEPKGGGRSKDKSGIKHTK